MFPTNPKVEMDKSCGGLEWLHKKEHSPSLMSSPFIHFHHCTLSCANLKAMFHSSATSLGAKYNYPLLPPIIPLQHLLAFSLF